MHNEITGGYTIMTSMTKALFFILSSLFSRRCIWIWMGIGIRITDNGVSDTMDGGMTLHGRGVYFSVSVDAPRKECSKSNEYRGFVHVAQPKRVSREMWLLWRFMQIIVKGYVMLLAANEAIGTR
jgi:hypothetical protein